MDQIERFFHIRPEIPENSLDFAVRTGRTTAPASRGGATVRVIGNKDTVYVAHALCSANDAFCRKTGRITASGRITKQMKLEELPGYLQEVARTVTSRVLKLSHSKRRRHHLWDTDFSFATKYFEPKKETVSA